MISIVLVQPEIPGNIGAVARSMANFGFSKLVLVRPNCNFLSDEARNRAKWANNILKKAKVFKDMEKLREEFDYLIATTGRLGTDYNLSRTPIFPGELSEKISSLPKNKKVAVVFGRESKGLFNKELALCDFVTTIPSSGDYPSLNLSHSVNIILYEISKRQRTEEMRKRFPAANRDDREQLDRMFNSVLDNIDFSTPRKKLTQKNVWRRVLEKALLTKRESRALMGFFAQLKKQKHKKK